MPRRLQLDEDAIVAAYQTGMTISAIAAAQGTSRRPVRRVLDEHRVPVRAAALPRPDRAAIVAAYEAGTSLDDLCAQLDLSAKAVRALLHRGGSVRRMEPRRPPLPSEAAAIEAAYCAGATVNEVAARFGIGRLVVAHLLWRAGVPRRSRSRSRTCIP